MEKVVSDETLKDPVALADQGPRQRWAAHGSRSRLETTEPDAENHVPAAHWPTGFVPRVANLVLRQTGQRFERQVAQSSAPV